MEVSAKHCVFLCVSVYVHCCGCMTCVDDVLLPWLQSTPPSSYATESNIDFFWGVLGTYLSAVSNQATGGCGLHLLWYMGLDDERVV